MQEIIVGLIVALAAVALVWRLMPAVLKRKLAQLHPALAGINKSSGCGGCSACGDDSCAPGAKKP
ncbi:MAG: hypothetical protein RR473_00255 [Comamonas sp.]